MRGASPKFRLGIVSLSRNALVSMVQATNSSLFNEGAKFYDVSFN